MSKGIRFSFTTGCLLRWLVILLILWVLCWVALELVKPFDSP